MKTFTHRGFKIYRTRSGSNLRLISIKGKSLTTTGGVFECAVDPRRGHAAQVEAVEYVKANIDDYLDNPVSVLT